MGQGATPAELIPHKCPSNRVVDVDAKAFVLQCLHLKCLMRALEVLLGWMLTSKWALKSNGVRPILQGWSEPNDGNNQQEPQR